MNHGQDVREGSGKEEPIADRRRQGGRPRHLLVAPLVWGLHFGFLYGIGALACSDRGPDLGATRAVVILATVVALALLAWACASAWRLRRALADEAVTPARRQRRFLATTTLATSALAGAAVVFDTLPVLLSASCA